MEEEPRADSSHLRPAWWRSIGSSIALCDFNGDGRDDLQLVRGAEWTTTNRNNGIFLNRDGVFSETADQEIQAKAIALMRMVKALGRQGLNIEWAYMSAATSMVRPMRPCFFLFDKEKC